MKNNFKGVWGNRGGGGGGGTYIYEPMTKSTI